jgi:hypothetical protein
VVVGGVGRLSAGGGSVSQLGFLGSVPQLEAKLSPEILAAANLQSRLEVANQKAIGGIP